MLHRISLVREWLLKSKREKGKDMYKYILGRLLVMIPVILALTFVVFTIMYFTPGDPTAVILGNEYSEEASEQLKAELGLDKPFFVQYANYVIGLCQGNFGMSYITRAPVGEQLGARFPNTFKIVMAAMASEMSARMLLISR